MRTPLLLSAMLACAAATPARAEFVIASCTQSAGCTCRLADLTVDDLALVTGEKPPAGARDMTLVHTPGRDPYWTSADRTEINVLHGGAGQCDVQLFAEMVPENGTWTLSAEQTNLERCPMLRGKALENAGLRSATRSIVWDGAFHPSKLIDADAGSIRWKKIGDNRWRGTLFDEKRGGTSGATVQHEFTLVTPRLIQGLSSFDFNIDVPAEQAAIMASMGVPMQCSSRTPFTARLDG